MNAARDEVRSLLGTAGRFELVRGADAVRAGAGGRALAAAAALLLGPWALAVLPGVVDARAVRATGAGFGPMGFGLLVGAALAVPALATLRRRDVGRRPVALAASAGASLLLLLAALSSRPMGGIGVAAGLLLGLAHGSVLSLVIDLYHPFARVRALAAAVTGGAVGAALVPTVLALGGGLGLSWRGSGVVVAAIAAAATAIGVGMPDAPEGALDEAPANAWLRRSGGEDGAADEPHEPVRAAQELRMLLAPPTIRPSLSTAAAAGLLLGPLPDAVDLLLRDRWVVVSTTRPLVVGLVLAGAAAAPLAVGGRAEVAWRAAPTRLVHVVAWTAALAGVALAVAAVLPHPLLAVAPLGLAAAAGTVSLLGSLVTTSGIVPARLRPLAAAATAVTIAGGAVAGEVVLGAFGSRFGPAWGALALAGLLVALASVGVRSMPAVATDAEAAVDRLLDAERLASARRRQVHVPLLECRGIDFAYGQLQVLFDVSFTVDEGEMVALLGTNGAGKSTLLRVISGLGTPSRGSVALRGRDITYVPSDVRVAEGITQVPGGKAVFGTLTVLDNLRAYGYSLGRDAARVDEGIEQTFEAFPRLAERRDQLAATLSGGEQQMLALGKALILEPRLLLIDELSLGLAPKVVGELLDMVQRINRTGTAIVLVEQSVNIALSLVDHAYFMEKGQIRFDGRAAALLERPDLLRSVFLAEAGDESAAPMPAETSGQGR